MNVLQIADAFENVVEKSTLEYGINRLYPYSLPGYTWKAGLIKSMSIIVKIKFYN